MADALTQWLDNAGRKALLTGEEVIELSRTIQTTTGKARTRALNKLCEHNLRLVVRVVKKIISGRKSLRWNSETTLDLLQQGYLGLRRAAEKFDTTKGYKFSTYASPWIFQSASRWLHSRSSAIYIPEATLREISYRQRHGKPSKQAGATGDDRVLAAGERAMYVGSIDVRLNDEDGCNLSDILSAEDSVAYKHVGRDPFEFLKKKMDAIGIDAHAQELMICYARRGRISVAAAKAKFPYKNASTTIRRVTELLQEAA